MDFDESAFQAELSIILNWPLIRIKGQEIYFVRDRDYRIPQISVPESMKSNTTYVFLLTEKLGDQPFLLKFALSRFANFELFKSSIFLFPNLNKKLIEYFIASIDILLATPASYR